MAGGDVVIESDDLPPHLTAYYPDGAPNWTAWSGDGRQNPNRIARADFTVRVPPSPVSRNLTIDEKLVDLMTNSDSEYSPGPVGVTLNGVAAFNSLAAPGDSIEDKSQSFDAYGGHPERQGNYHYHTASPGPLEALAWHGYTENTRPGSATVELFGIMCDGTVLLGCTELDGSSVDTEEFDAQNGHVHDIADDEETHFAQRYHTHICPTAWENHPYTPEIQYHTECGR
jgi:hypothetical protein